MREVMELLIPGIQNKEHIQKMQSIHRHVNILGKPIRMKNLFIMLILFFVISLPHPASATSPTDSGKTSSGSSTRHIQLETRQDSAFELIDVIVYRPIGFAATIVGAALFIGISPLTALASIPAPHDAFEKTADILVFTPGEYTFTRPIGDRSLAY